MVESVQMTRRRESSMSLWSVAALSLSLFLAMAASRASAADVLFDAEMDSVLRDYSEPLLRAAGLKEDSVTFLVLASDDVNALASPGLVQLYSGLVLRTRTPSELQGVIAHEIAHIAAGHTTRMAETVEKVSLISVASLLLGIGAIVAGVPELGAVLLGGTPAASIYQQLGVSRLFEASADQAAASYLDAAGVSGMGLVRFFEREFTPRDLFLKDTLGVSVSPYILTHPLTSERLISLQKRVSEQRHADTPDPARRMKAHEMIKAKLFAFLKTPAETRAAYPLSSRTKPARYAHALMFSRQYRVPEALASIDSLLAEEPNNPYFHEMRAYILTQAGKVEEALPHYHEAIRLAGSSPILNLEVGRAILASERRAMVRQAIPYLKRAVRDRKLTNAGYRAIARAYDLLGDRGAAELATAEAYVSSRIYDLAFLHASKALTVLGSAEKTSRLRAEDIMILSRDKMVRQPPVVAR